MSDHKQARELLEARDLSALRGMGDADIGEIFGFHAQQAVEKLFKAWLALLGETYPTTHSLARLLEKLRRRDDSASRFDELVEYAPYAVQFRYAGADQALMPLDRGEVVRRVERCWNGCGGKARRLATEPKDMFGSGMRRGSVSRTSRAISTDEANRRLCRIAGCAWRRSGKASEVPLRSGR